MIWLVLLLAQNQPSPGERIFAQNCSVGYCHGVGGAAGRGPRLRGRTFEKEYLLRVTRDGIPKSAMPGWKGRLTDEQIQAVVDYVASLAGAAPSSPAAAPSATPAAPDTPPPMHAGYRFFFDATREARCGTCHVVAGRGIPIGPDLQEVAGKPGDQITAAIQSSRSRHVMTARLKNGETFPALRVGPDGDWIRLYDLTVVPPVLRTLTKSEIASLDESSSWRHDTVIKDYKPDELSEIVQYLRAPK